MRWRKPRHDDIQEEIRAHLDLETDRLIRTGLSESEARQAAHRAFGNRTRVEEQAYERGLVLWVDHFIQDLRYATRVLVASRTFTLTTVLILGISVGLCTAVFTQVRNAFFSPVPGISDPASFAEVEPQVSFPVYESFSDAAGPFSTAAAYIMAVPFAWKEEPAYRPMGEVVTPNYFQVLGVGIQAGRGFESDETVSRISPNIVVSDRFWRNRLRADPRVIGTSLHLNGRIATIIGVARRDFFGAAPALGAPDLWVSTTSAAGFVPDIASETFLDVSKKLFVVVGRLKAGVTGQFAQTQLSVLARPFENQSADDAVSARSVSLVSGARQLPIPDGAIKTVTPIVVVVPTVLTTLILWIVCSNVGTMLIARSAARRREIAIRLSLGASRSRVVRQFLTESGLVAALGGVAGFIFAIGFRAFSGAGADDRMPAVTDVKLGLATLLSNVIRFAPEAGRLDWAALFFCFAVSLVCALMFGLLPALRATRANIAQDLVPASHWQCVKARWISVRNVLMLQQIAGSTAVLLVSGFIALGMYRTAAVDLGFETGNVYLFSIDPIRNGYSVERTEEFFSRLPERLKSIGGVQDATLADELPLIGGGGTTARVQTDEISVVVGIQRVGVGFFETTGLPIKRGRPFADIGRESLTQIVVNETLSSQTWQTQDPIGKEVLIDGRQFEVIGVVQDTPSGIFPSVQPVVFYPMTRADFGRVRPSGILVIVRATPGANPVRGVEDELRRIDPDVTIFNRTSLTEEVRRIFVVARRSVLIYTSIGLFGLIIAALGLAGVTALAVVQRTKEIGIRIAMGATRSGILLLVTKEGFVLLAIGTVLGEALAFALTRVLGSWFYALATVTNTSASDPILVLGAPVLLGFLTMLVCAIPARRSINLNPVEALRED